MILDVIEKAIRERRCVTVVHDGTTRRVAPHAVGFTRDDVPAVFVFQYAGQTTSTLPFEGEWRCLHFAHLSHASENGDRWRSPSNYSLSRQTCLKQIVLAVAEG
ncbi:MAG: hypothetical protein KIS73_19275 [Enhydrobacter sp.]|nr:hypothetical protein [Enhydrobacter sp.]